MKNGAKNIQVTLVSVIETAMSFRGVSIEQLADGCKIPANKLKSMFLCNQEIDFITLAKIQKALKVKFQVTAIN